VASAQNGQLCINLTNTIGGGEPRGQNTGCSSP